MQVGKNWYAGTGDGKQGINKCWPNNARIYYSFPHSPAHLNAV